MESIVEIKSSLLTAMQKGVCVSLLYYKERPLPSGGLSTRFVEPWGIGIRRETGTEQLRVYQVKGDSLRHEKTHWKTILLSEIRKVIVLDGITGGLQRIQPRSDFKVNDKHIKFQYYYKGR